MDDEFAARFTTLPRLDAANASSYDKPCRMCGGQAAFFDVTDFWKGSNFYPFGPSGITVHYYRCAECGFMFTPLCDDWTAEDFRRYIYNDQYILVDAEYLGIRAKRVAAHMTSWLAGFKDARVLDYGSGAGVFAEDMQEAGFTRIISYDPFSEPKRPSGRFDIITCFEVIEHSPAPLKTIRDIASFLDDDGCVIIGECLQPPDIANIRCNWWYCMPRNGHVSLFTDRALAIGALGAHLLFHPGDGLHAFSRPVAGRFASLANRVSSPLFPVSLGAPREGGDAHWHAIERFCGAPTRWTASRQLSWRVAIPTERPVRALIRVPFALEVKQGFGAESRILVDGLEAKTFISDCAIVAEARVENRSSIEVTLQTPDVVSPSELRNSADLRRLGLAIRCEQTLD